MNLLEHEAKTILASFGITVPTNNLLPSKKPINTPIVLKSQVPVGGRGKAGGIVVVENQKDLEPTAVRLLGLAIKDHLPKVILAEEKLSIQKELYLSILVDRSSASIKIVAHKNGGIEVEDNTDFAKWPIIDKKQAEAIGQSLADYYELPGQSFALQDLIENLYGCFVTNDATLIEINPLVLTSDEKLVAADCKMTLDDAAAFRHDWKFEQSPIQANFVTIHPDGNTATIANGAGLAMATVDAVYEAGLKPANFLDIGGGANEKTLLAAFAKIVEYKNLQAIIINIFAGITQADEVARAIVSAKKQILNLPPLFIRIAGTNYGAAQEILTANNIPLLPGLAEALGAAKKVVHD